MLDNTMRERWRYYLKRRLDQNGDDRRDIWIKGVRQLRRMKIVSGDERPAPFGAPAPTVFAGVTWAGIGPQPLRIDKDQQFQGSGPASGEVVDIAIDPTGAADSVIYVATNNGGVWKSINGGATWTPKTDLMPSLSMGSIEIDPVDHQIIYAGTGNNFDGGRQGIRGAGIYRSIDAGDTWTVLGSSLFSGLLITRISIPATNVLLVATNNGLFRSVDGGQSFGANAPDFNDGLPVRTGFFTDLQLDTANSATVYACRRGSGILRSTDGGVTFPTDLFANPGAPAAPFDFISFAQSTSPDNQVLYALVTDAAVPPPGAKFKGLFRSPDRGANWTLMPGAAGPAAENKGLQNGYDVTLAVDPKDPNRVYIGFQELYLSTDGGLNFGTPAISANLVHFDNHATIFTPHGPAAAPTPFYTATDGGIARNDDGNTAWTNLNETIATNLILGMDIGRNSAANNAFTYAGCQDTGTIQRRPTFTGNDWHLGIDGDGTRVVVDPNNPLRAYARDNQFLIITSDGGTNWTFPTSASTGLPDSGGFSVSKPMGVDPNSSAVVYVALDKALFISTDTGATFTVMHTFLGNVSCLETTKLDSKILMVGCEDGTVHRTTNADAGAGANFVPVTINGAPNLIVSAIAMDPTDNKSVVATYSGFTGVAAGTRTKHVFSSADVANVAMEDISGTDGASPDSNVPDLPVHAVIWDPSTVPHSIIIGCDTDVLRSTDSGATWHIYGAGIPNADCTQLAADYTLSPPLIRVGTYGRSAFELIRPSGPNIVVRSNLAFGGVATGGSADVDFNIFNVGDANLTITDISDPTANPNFALVTPPGFPFDIGPGNLATLTLRFSPTAPGKQITAYSISCNDPTHPLFGLPVSGLASFTGPQVTSLIPASGPPAGGTAVQVRGSVFTGATAVNFGTTAASGMTVDSDTQISCVSPAGTGTVTVSVVTPAGTTAAGPASQFTYSSSGIVVTGLNPTEGPETGGTSVIISGAGFTGTTQVLFGGFAATGFTVDNASQVTAVSPAGTGTVDVLVATPAGTSGVSPAAKFRYQVPAGGVATGGTGTGTGTDTGATGGGGGEELVMSALADILRSGTDPEVLEAQRILLRRIALEGNIVDSRIPAPKNITEVGGYVNLLTTLGHTDIRTQMLASALGVAGPATPIGLSGEGAPLAFINLANDRPQGPAQPTFATTFTVRSDMADATAQALQRIRGAGCALPLSTPPRILPVATPGRVLQPDLLVILGRVLQVAPSALLTDPSADPVAIARRETDPPDRWQLVVREIDGESRVAFASWLAYQATDTNIAIMPPAQRQYLPIAQILADAGWYSTEPFAAPASIAAQGSLPRLVNVTGLVRGQTLLGEELLLLYAQPVVMASALAGMLSWIWNGTAFVPPLPPTGP